MPGILTDVRRAVKRLAEGVEARAEVDLGEGLAEGGALVFEGPEVGRGPRGEPLAAPRADVERSGGRDGSDEVGDREGGATGHVEGIASLWAGVKGPGGG